MATQCYQCTGEPQYKCAPISWNYKTCMDAPQKPFPQWAEHSQCQKYCNPGPPKPGFRAICWKKENGKCVRVVPEKPEGGYYSKCPAGFFDTREGCKTGFTPIVVRQKYNLWIYLGVGLGALGLVVLFVILIVWLTYRRPS